MFTQLYKHLKENGFDVYSIGQHEGICTKPYIVIKENGESEIVGTSLTNDIVELLIYRRLSIIIISCSSLKQSTSRGLLPFAGPTMPAFSSWSISRPARL